jgi:hypothetical protein
MNSPVSSIDISHNTELLRIVEKVADTKKPYELKLLPDFDILIGATALSWIRFSGCG